MNKQRKHTLLLYVQSDQQLFSFILLIRQQFHLLHSSLYLDLKLHSVGSSWFFHPAVLENERPDNMRHGWKEPNKALTGSGVKRARVLNPMRTRPLEKQGGVWRRWKAVKSEVSRAGKQGLWETTKVHLGSKWCQKWKLCFGGAAQFHSQQQKQTTTTCFLNLLHNTWAMMLHISCQWLSNMERNFP